MALKTNVVAEPSLIPRLLRKADVTSEIERLNGEPCTDQKTVPRKGQKALTKSRLLP